MNVMTTHEHPLTDVLEMEGIRQDLSRIYDALDERIGDFAVQSFWISDDDDDQGTLCAKCADARYDELVAKTKPGETKEYYICDDGPETGPSTCQRCHVTLEYGYCESTSGQEMDHFREHSGDNTYFCRSDGYSFARLAEFAEHLTIESLDLMREIRDMASAHLSLPDAEAEEPDRKYP